ncbi:MAG TPA: ParB/RepB/Spo0J family partition protein [Candidatus Udaeobacter sp.]|nr:ParB/RepB/Spo0J family partition protein [Candidatus Udaeobacter sp.]
MALGRGLNALISGGTKQSQNTTNHSSGQDNVWYIPVTSISPNTHQPRQNFSGPELEDLAASIKEHGILQPLLVTEKADGGYELIAGERRWRASQMVGLATVPVLIKKFADQQKLEVALIENIQRENLNPIEEAFAYQRLMQEFNLTQQDVAEKVGKSRPAVANTVRLLSLPEEVKTALVDKRINMSQARALLSLDDQKQQLDMLSSMLGQRITVRELEREVGRQNPQKSHRDPNLAYLEDQLRTALGTKVAITQKGKRGTIIIDYYSQEELAKIIKKIIPN